MILVSLREGSATSLCCLWLNTLLEPFVAKLLCLDLKLGKNPPPLPPNADILWLLLLWDAYEKSRLELDYAFIIDFLVVIWPL
jgi:hypothetical protein